MPMLTLEKRILVVKVMDCRSDDLDLIPAVLSHWWCPKDIQPNCFIASEKNQTLQVCTFLQ